MSDQPFTLAVFQEFQRTLLDRFDSVEISTSASDDALAGRVRAVDDLAVAGDQVLRP